MDYWEYLREYGEHAGEAIYNALMAKYNNVQHVNDYITDIHPKTETQYEIQRGIASVWDWYKHWMIGRSEDEYNQHKKDMYDIDFEDITYPWLSGLDSTNGLQAMGSGAWEYSRNLSRLYR